MTVRYITEEVEQQVMDEFVCDRCSTILSVDDDIVALRNCLMLKFTAGYGSEYWGDGTTINVDLCEACMYEVLWPYVVYEHDGPEDGDGPRVPG